MEKNRYLRVDQVAARLNCSKEFIYKLIKNNQIAHMKIGAKRGFRILEDDLNDFILKNRKTK